MDEIEQAAYDCAKSIDNDERVIVGVNKFTVVQEGDPEVFPIDPALQAAQLKRLKAFKENRDANAVTNRLDEVREAAGEPRTCSSRCARPSRPARPSARSATPCATCSVSTGPTDRSPADGGSRDAAPAGARPSPDLVPRHGEG
ncbi:MAG: methylmalonyl-CoA mutase family protein [Ilumatobacteraceae bacterium]